MGIARHHNADFNGGSPNLPEALNDRFWGQDWQRNFWYLLERSGLSVMDAFGKNGLIIKDGTIIKGTNWDDINIPACVGYAEFDITAQDETQVWQVPALSKTVTLESVRIETPAVGNFDISGATLDGATTNYLKMAYAESSGRTRQKSNDPASWTFEKAPSVLITGNATPNTSKEVLLATFVGNGTSTLVITEEFPLALDDYLDQHVKKTDTPLFAGVTLKAAADADRNIEFASDADMLWDESEDEFNLNKPLNVPAKSDVTSGVTQVLVETGNDSRIRHGSKAAIRTFADISIIDVVSSDPGSPVAGQMWLRSDLV